MLPYTTVVNIIPGTVLRSTVKNKKDKMEHLYGISNRVGPGLFDDILYLTVPVPGPVPMLSGIGGMRYYYIKVIYDTAH